jgi:hypothetical protein
VLVVVDPDAVEDVVVLVDVAAFGETRHPDPALDLLLLDGLQLELGFLERDGPELPAVEVEGEEAAVFGLEHELAGEYLLSGFLLELSIFVDLALGLLLIGEGQENSKFLDISSHFLRQLLGMAEVGLAIAEFIDFHEQSLVLGEDSGSRLDDVPDLQVELLTEFAGEVDDLGEGDLDGPVIWIDAELERKGRVIGESPEELLEEKQDLVAIVEFQVEVVPIDYLDLILPEVGCLVQ